LSNAIGTKARNPSSHPPSVTKRETLKGCIDLFYRIAGRSEGVLLADHRLSPARFEGIASPPRLRIGGSTSANVRFARVPGRAVFVTALQAFGGLADDQATRVARGRRRTCGTHAYAVASRPWMTPCLVGVAYLFGVSTNGTDASRWQIGKNVITLVV
jgi:hypothetical protein